jgi:hypothetical protein
MKKPFEQAVADLMKVYGFVDYAVVCRAVDREMVSFWNAGANKSALDDRERINNLKAEVDILSFTLLLKNIPHDAIAHL